eukprot:jgi/Chlat1/2594/Chrsp178S02448
MAGALAVAGVAAPPTRCGSLRRSLSVASSDGPSGRQQPAPQVAGFFARFRRRRPLLLGAAAAAAAAVVACVASPSSRLAQEQASAAEDAAAAFAASPLQHVPVDLETDANGVERVAYRPDGWNRWVWEGHNINYIKHGETGPPVVLVHGFGASAYHWRYNIPALAKHHRVYALDLLGFGLSDKATGETVYGSELWSRQLATFIDEVVGGEPCVLAGNSLGGFASLHTAADNPDKVRGVVLLNAAGRFAEAQRAAVALVDPESKPAVNSVLSSMMTPFATMAKRAAIYYAFVRSKEEGSIRSVLNNVYINSANVDDDLVRSIRDPALHNNAYEVFYRVSSQVQGNARITFNDLITRLETARTPMLLLWGDRDPWMRSTTADRIVSLYPYATLARLNAGHCPHDEAPEDVNRHFLRWLASI